MSAFDSACRLARAIARSSKRDEVAQALHDLNFAVPGGSQSGMFGYLARRGRFHFLEYLFLNANLQTVRERLPATELNGLSDDQWKILGEADKFMREINARVLDVMTGSGTVLVEASDPYELVVEPRYHPSTPAPKELMRGCEAELGELAESVREHPALRRLSAMKGTTQALEADHKRGLAAEIERLSAEIVRMSRSPDVFRVQQLKGAAPGTPAAVAQRLRSVADLLCLRQFLITVDQLVFTAFKQDKLVALTEDTVFSASLGSDSLGSYATLSIQPVSREYFIQPRDIVMLAPPEMDVPPFLRGPAEVHSIVESLSRETGNSVTLDVRMLDEWLNPYSGLTDA